MTNEFYDIGNNKLLTKVCFDWALWLIHPADVDAFFVTEEEARYNEKFTIFLDSPAGYLFDHSSHLMLRRASIFETVMSLVECNFEGGEGVIYINGKKRFVAGGLKPRQWANVVGEA